MVIGLTGGIGSGKSTVINYIKEKTNAKILITDDIAKKLMNPREISYNKIVDYFGKEILDENNNIDNLKLSQIVFNDKEKLEKLNSFTHPYVIKYIENFIKENKDFLIIIESALLLETTLKDLCGEIWFIKTSKEIRIKRLKEGRNYSEERINAVLRNQKPDSFYEKYCKIVINNNSLEIMKEQINKNIYKYL